ncbi:hypothetical protein [Laribacter hongkongensis]|uniref:hypothetical protein n=1 Tax=Laribacter hongkongensis TaxID=168471 RepID=UPI001EFDE764|nr:hypothetical protein [Laribacter hongkongensis]MCG9032481.1 hypothetical protein [Laribacter hongkongensis]MCG9091874.1 hypothetical protein [Laribacter hongkongensis]
MTGIPECLIVRKRQEHLFKYRQPHPCYRQLRARPPGICHPGCTPTSLPFRAKRATLKAAAVPDAGQREGQPSPGTWLTARISSHHTVFAHPGSAA